MTIATNQLKPEYIKLKFEGNQLSCSVELPNGETCPIVAYGLLLNNSRQAIVEEYSTLYQHTFTIKKNGRYKIRVYYKSEGVDKKNKSFESVSTTIKLNTPSQEQVNESILIYSEKNRIICDASDALFSHIVEYSISYGTERITKIPKDHFFSYVVPETNLYKINISYEDYDGILQQIERELYIKRVELSSSTASTNIKDVNNKDIKLLFNILWAFIIREFQRKYDRGYFRYFSIIISPTIQIGIMVIIFTLVGRHSVLGLSIPLFVLTGILPYSFFTSAGNCLTIVTGNRSLLNYRQIKIIDVILSNILMELIVTTLSFCGGLLACWYFGMNIVLYNPLSLLLAFGLLFIFTFGLAMILSVVGFYFAEFNHAIHVIFRTLFYISGVFFSIENIPVQYQRYLLWNPLLQVIEFIRFSFVKFQLPHELSYIYLFKCTLICFTLGLALYFINRHKFLINDQARV